MKKSKTLKTGLSLLLTVALVTGVTSEAYGASLNPASTAETLTEGSSGDLPALELLTRVLPEGDLPEVISAQEAAEQDHVNRLREQEDDDAIVLFQNRDGTKTAYFFEEAVKYVDENGVTKDKSTALSTPAKKSEFSGKYSYVTADNDVKTLLPKELDSRSGVTLQKEDFVLEVSPAVNQEAKAINPVLSDNSAVYSGAFGERTAVSYTPQYNGFKEDIILESYTGTNRFANRIITNGLLLVADGAVCLLVEPDTDEIVATIGEIVVYDSRPDSQERTAAVNYYEIEVVAEGSEYILTQVVDDSFLRADDTVYPVTVDPIYTFSNQNNTRDTTVYNGTQDSSAHTRTTLTVGNTGSGFNGGTGRARALINFSTMFSTSSSPLAYMAPGNINSATLKVTLDRFYTDYYLDVHMVTASWSETSMSTSTANTLFTKRESSRLTGKTNLYGGLAVEFNVYSAITGWMGGSNGGTSNPYGFMLSVRNDTTSSITNHGLIYSSEHGTSDKRPRLVINYSMGCALSYDDIQVGAGVPPNCVGFALMKKHNVQLQLPSAWASVEETATAVINYFNNNTSVFRTIRRVSGVNISPNFPIESWEYRVALRVRTKSSGYDDFDYHMYVQTNYGKWAHKRGGLASEELGYINPTTSTWAGGYNSSVIYFAVTL